eukprot:351839-Chlamydomonas_euryale.AAC.1
MAPTWRTHSPHIACTLAHTSHAQPRPHIVCALAHTSRAQPRPHIVCALDPTCWQHHDVLSHMYACPHLERLVVADRAHVHAVGV